MVSHIDEGSACIEQVLKHRTPDGVEHDTREQAEKHLRRQRWERWYDENPPIADGSVAYPTWRVVRTWILDNHTQVQRIIEQRGLWED